MPEADVSRYMYDVRNTIAAVSHGVPYYPINSTHFSYYEDVAFPQPVISGSAEAIHAHSGYASVAARPLSHIMASIQGVQYLVRVLPLTTGAFGMDLWGVLAVSHEEALAELAEVLEEKKESIAEGRKEVDDQIADDTYLVIGVVCAISIITAILVVTGARWMFSPIKLLEQDMAWVADMHLDRPLSELSILQEVRSMQSSFRVMVAKLREFKPYVPLSVLQGSCDELAKGWFVEPPSGSVTFVFTDIKGSAALWETAPCDMDFALEAHNKIMREALKATEGYEVKTIGDSFMVAFADPVSALKFAFKAQHLLLEYPWPPELGLPVMTGQNGKPLDGGLQVRMGAHCGVAALEKNPITGRSDYRGGVVNMASRLEGKAIPGTLCCSTEFYESVRSAMNSSDSAASGSVKDYGEQDLKGLGSHKLFMLAPFDLKERLSPTSAAYSEEPARVMRFADSSSKASLQRDFRKRTDLFLEPLEATIAVCRVIDTEGSVFEACNQVIRCASDAALLTDGSVLSMCGSHVFVAWNTVRNVKLHASAALQFAGEMQNRCRHASVRVGIATGQVQFGNVGTVAKRFSIVIGKTVTAAFLAAETCVQLRCFSMFANCAVVSNWMEGGSVHSLLRLVDIWLDSSSGDRRVFVYQVLTDKMNDLDCVWQLAEDPALGEHDKTFQNALAGCSNALNRLRMLADSDETLAAVVTNIATSTSGSFGYRHAYDLRFPFVSQHVGASAVSSL
ncbi:Adenylate cyclase [Diplonema papillatum]|nr:Adenylate cyclase [Diplonema papillatum]